MAIRKFTQEQLDQGRRLAKKMQMPGQPFIRYRDGKFLLNDHQDKDITGATFIAAPDEAMVFYKLFEEGGVTETLRYNMISEKDPGRPDSHKDREQWKINPKSPPDKPQRMDPWNRSLNLPMFRLGDDGECDGTLVLLQAETRLMQIEIGALVEYFIESGGDTRVFIKLTTIENPNDSAQTLPKLEILGDSGNTMSIVFAEDGTISIAKDEGDDVERPINKKRDFDDDIGF